MLQDKYLLLAFSLLILLVGCNGANDNNVNGKPNNEQMNEEMNHPNNDNDDDHQNENNEFENGNHNNSDNVEEDLSVFDGIDESIIQLVNKENELGPDDHPIDLVTITVPFVLDNPEINQLREEAANALEEMFAVAKENNIILYARSGFRSYQTQEQLFSSYAERNGIDAANRYSAKPGQSEHQTGLVMDITSESVNFDLSEDFGKTPEGEWVANNAHLFGFIIRYPEGKEDITGYIYEPWHLRYLSPNVATAVFESGLTYEEFFAQERNDE